MTYPGRTPHLFSCLILPLVMLWAALPAAALDLSWPVGADRVSQDQSDVAGFRIATGVHDGSQVPTTDVSGVLIDEVWTIPGDMGDPARLAVMIGAQLTAQGYALGFACADIDCGGFDFRFDLPIAQAPAMHVDLGRFQYLTATRRTAEGTEHLALTLSHGGQVGYAHLARVLPHSIPSAQTTPATLDNPAPVAPGTDLIARLRQSGSVVLTDVRFATGASALEAGQIDSLATLARYLAENPTRRIVLVGHTDTEGALEGNIALSRARAMAVRDHLVGALGANPAQIEAAGIGYLAPRASNATETGRETNRRVEVVLTAE